MKPPKDLKRFRLLFLLGMAIGLLLLTGGAYASLTDPGPFLPLVYRAWPPPTSTPLPGRVLVSEVLYDPDGLEPDGEWIELYNPGGLPVDLSEYKLGDEETLGEQEGMYRFPPGAMAAPGQVLLVAYRAVTFESVYAFPPDFEFQESDPLVPNMVRYTAWAGGSVQLENTGDEVLVFDGQGARVDAVSWGGSTEGLDPSLNPVSSGHSLERAPAYRDNDTAGDWIDQAAPDPGGVDLSPLPITPSPTAPGDWTPVPPSPPSLLISEVLFDPDGLEPDGEWIELYNYGDAPVDAAGLKLGDEETPGGSEGMQEFPSGVVIPAGETLVIAHRGDDFMAVYGFPPNLEMVDSQAEVADMLNHGDWSSGQVALSNSGDELLLLDAADDLLDALSWGSSSYAFDPPLPSVTEGVSLERYPPGADSDTAQDWREQPNPDPGSVDLTPPTPTPNPTPGETTVAPPHLAVNEIHADPDPALGDANGDGVVDPSQDEFIEIANLSGASLDLSGWRLEDLAAVRHIFPPGSVIPDSCVVVVFGGGSPVGDFGGSLVMTASQGLLGFNNNGDALTLYDPQGNSAAAYTYGPEGGEDQSLTRDPDLTGPEPLVRHSLAAGSAGALYSPGTLVDGALFTGCTSVHR